MEVSELAKLLTDGGPWAVVALSITGLVSIWRAREKDNREHYETAIKWAEQGAEREGRLNEAIETLSRAFGGRDE